MVWEYQINEAYWQGHKGGRGLKLLKDLEKLSLACYTEEDSVHENNGEGEGIWKDNKTETWYLC